MTTTTGASSPWSKPTSTGEALKTLELLRARHVHASEQVLENANFLFAHNVNVQKKMGDEYWAFVEQLARAALDCGQDELADDCITRLDDRFPDAPRVQVLQGMQREAVGKLEDALKLYDLILGADEANAGVWKRRIAVYRQLGETQAAVKDLCAYLDTFYTDVEGWLELADLYSSTKAYAHALQTLSHAMALAPQNPFYVLQFAETAAANDDFSLSLKMHLRVAEMVEGDEEDGFRHDDNQAAHQAWLGVHLSAKRLLEGRVTVTAIGADPSIQPPSTEDLQALEALAAERIAAGGGSS